MYDQRWNGHSLELVKIERLQLESIRSRHCYRGSAHGYMVLLPMTKDLTLRLTT